MKLYVNDSEIDISLANTKEVERGPSIYELLILR